MDVTELASSLNTLAIFFVIVISLRVHRRHPEPFFYHWVAAHLFEGLLMAMEVVANVAGERPLGFTLVQIAVVAASVYHMVQTGRTLQGKPLSAKGAAALVALIALPTLALAAQGLGHGALAIWPLLVVLGTTIWLGLAFIFDRRLSSVANTMWLGVPLAAKGVVAVGYTWFLASGLLWLQNIIGLGIHLITGVGMIMLLVDRTTDDLRRKNAALEELDTLKRHFLQTMHHELKTPLTVIGGMAELLRVDPEGLDRYADTIETRVRHLDGLVNDILDFSRLEAHELTLTPEDEDLGQLVEEVAGPMAPLFEQAGLTLQIEAPTGVPARCDRLRMVQVLTNMLDNARKFTPTGGVVTLSARAVGGEAVLTLSDTGCGIAPEHQARIFEKFHQIDGSSTRQHGGLGLGLAICKHLVERHGGRITVESAPGRGSTFRVALPLNAPADPTSKETPLAHAR
ncbi:MAG: sensor histidine kinase [Candidatus Sericytochromatia bacterium]